MSQTFSALSTADLRKHIDRLPRFPLGHFPTPLESLERFSEALGGPMIHIKRDDCTGLAFGGNKTRHNEFLMAAALAQGADMFVWGAGVQSNNCRQTAAACAKAGLDCQLILGRGKGKTGDEVVQGNLLLDHLVGADYRIVDATIGEELDDVIEATANRHRAKGRNVYSWNRETVKPLAAVSYAQCVAEIADQTKAEGIKPSAIYVSSAGSTGSGTQLGVTALGLGCPVYNICPIQWEWDTQEDMAHLATVAAKLIGLDLHFEKADINVTFDYIGPAYGKVSEGGLEALMLLARTEGILLDPIYSGKAMAGLIDDIRKGKYRDDEEIVFIHTGGTPALFAYNDDLVRGMAKREIQG
ncbi:MAG: D-cysteine desulfhydrase family protein [Planctomycetota bacterium]|nr:D-cysteine desulfhydrase family protein [Planctomycetota bacterium]MDA1212276.1 D-cysteine desulfhydrase family protein [Planctomycetota bacterium]